MPPRTRTGTPTAAERDVVAVYQRAERALLQAAAREAGKAARNTSGQYAAVPAAVQAVRDATRAVVAQLDVVTPGLLADALTTSTEHGARQAADTLRNLPGRDRGMHDVNTGALDRVALALLDRTTEVHRAILRSTPDRFRTALEHALPAGLVGVDTRREVTQRAVWDLTRAGITEFRDASGRRWRASTYMEMATRTAMQRATEAAKLDRLRAAGHDLVIVQGGRDRCPRCLPWNGRILSITGATPTGTQTVPDAIDGTEQITVVVAGTVDDARAAGWGHPNCRCDLDLYQPGITRDPPAAERTPDGQYQARQQQRAIERSIRGARELEAAALDKMGAKQARADVRAAQARMRDHLAENPDLLRRSYREQIGAGNLPTDEQAERFARDEADRLGDVRGPLLSKLRAAQVEQRRAAAEARGDTAAAGRYADERVRRDVALIRARKRKRERRDVAS